MSVKINESGKPCIQYELDDTYYSILNLAEKLANSNQPDDVEALKNNLQKIFKAFDNFLENVNFEFNDSNYVKLLLTDENNFIGPKDFGTHPPFNVFESLKDMKLNLVAYDKNIVLNNFDEGITLRFINEYLRRMNQQPELGNIIDALYLITSKIGFIGCECYKENMNDIKELMYQLIRYRKY